jgi:hypothetical protein
VAVEHDLGREDLVIGEHARVVLLARAEGRAAERVAPPETVPVVDVLLERDHRDPFDRLRSVERVEVSVRGWARAAPLRREELDDHGDTGRGRDRWRRFAPSADEDATNHENREP